MFTIKIAINDFIFSQISLSLFYKNMDIVMYIIIQGLQEHRYRMFCQYCPPLSTLNENTPHLHTPLNHNPSVPICVIDAFLACQSGTGKDVVLQRAVLWPIDHPGIRESQWTNKGRAGCVYVILTRAPSRPRLLQHSTLDC